MAEAKACEQCGGEFTPYRKTTKYCGPDCARDAHNTKTRRAAVEPRPCEQCGETYQPRRIDQRCCSMNCSSKFSNGARSDESPGMHDHDDGSKTIVTDPRNTPPAPWTPDALLRAHGLDPEEWEIVRVRGNRWGDPGEPMHQLRVDVVPRRLLIVAPDPNDWKAPPKPRRRKGASPRKVVICGDHHCPEHDPVLHSLFLEWLADEQPDEGVILGDLLDLPSGSRHRRGKDGADATVNECLSAALKVLRDYRHASPDTFWTLLPGNHDDRLDAFQIDRAVEIYDVAPGGGEDITGEEDERPALSMRRLLYLDELGIDLVPGDYNRAKHLLGRKLSIRHGYLAGKNAADKMLAKISRSVVQGHTHRLRVIYVTAHDGEEPEPTTTRVGAEAGTMAQIANGLGYADEPNWQQGFLVAHLWSDDDFTLAPVPYVPGRLLAPSGKRYAA